MSEAGSLRDFGFSTQTSQVLRLRYMSQKFGAALVARSRDLLGLMTRALPSAAD